jgi:hypothetical protein
MQPSQDRCDELPDVRAVRQYVRAFPAQPLSFWYDAEGMGLVVEVRLGPEEARRYTIAQAKPFAGTREELPEGTDLLTDYEEGDKVGLDPVSLARVLSARGLGCSAAAAREAALRAVKQSIDIHVADYGEAKDETERLWYARNYVLDAIGALTVLRALGYEPAAALWRREELTALLYDRKASPARLMQVGAEMNGVIRQYLAGFDTGERATAEGPIAKEEAPEEEEGEREEEDGEQEEGVGDEDDDLIDEEDDDEDEEDENDEDQDDEEELDEEDEDSEAEEEQRPVARRRAPTQRARPSKPPKLTTKKPLEEAEGWQPRPTTKVCALPTAQDVRSFLRQRKREPISIFDDRGKFGRRVLLRNADGTVEQFRLSTGKPYWLTYDQRAENTDVLRGYAPSDEVELDPASLARVAAQIGCSRYQEFARSQVEASAKHYRAAYERAAPGDRGERLLQARRFALNGVGALAVMREMGFRPARQLADSEQPLTALESSHTTAATLMNLAVRMNRVAADYVAQFEPTQRPTGLARSTRDDERRRERPETQEDRDFIVPDTVED